MKIEKPAKRRPNVRKSKSKVVLRYVFFGFVKVTVQFFLLIDRFWPKIVATYHELF
jgi:hypothetical protein